ncbi:autotransporter outer membrane beta-barrel domain-containing protein [Salmonella enterica]|uniref:Autotransporter outer membrane beta-barrel domain-containing protein n=1 Tax=Salmonella enterica TaxID=28901 RepID=A0A8F0CXX6_SALER|nr:autotransporter outer membrane beta-barrel domain-containing protein [Salmonella enterica]EBP0195312.1 autotransporter outer membrane beta-barrel domain-containing protein [Salmonella enterica]PUF06699.1 autotransporter outer membrane beta-barrel domain-containing protein [Salmonella enterica subsp. enterica]PUQ39518.1 autotransporter outer membrane beta-barrel domain-containing protein [Salmonella enterica subsp. enterica]PUU60974.1 autotransporter outer membrane beta-barrel domain-containi
MAVENKFKRNFLAASILVGLSLSATSGITWAEDKTESAVELPENTSVASDSSSPQSELDVKENAEGELLSPQSTQEPTLGRTEGEEGKNIQTDTALDGKGETEEEGRSSDSGSESVSKEFSAKGTQDKNVKADENEQHGLFDKIVDAVKGALGGASDEEGSGDNTESQGDEPDAHSASDELQGADESLVDIKHPGKTEEQIEDKSETLPEDGAGTEVNDGAQLSSDGSGSSVDLPPVAAEKPVEQAAEKPAEPATDKPAEQAADKPAEQAADKPVEQAAEKPAEPATDKPAEQAAEKPAEPATDKPAEQAAEKPAEQAADKPAEQAADKPAEQAAEKPAEQAADKPVEQAAEKPAEPATDKPVEQAAEKPAEPATDKPAEQAADKPAVQPVVKPVEPKRTYSAAELNTSSESKPLTESLVVNVAPYATEAAPVIVTMGDAASKGGKVTPSSVWAQSDVALKLGGDLRTAQPELDKDAKPVAGKLAREADKIVLQNLNIHNSMPSLADRVDMLHSDIVGIQIGTQTTSATGALSAAPKDASILLDNVNITMQNGGRGTKAIDLVGNSNHILAKGGVIDAGEGYNASILDITGSNNVVDFVGSTLKGDIKSSEIYRAGQFVQPVDNTVNLKGSTLTGNAIAGTGSLSLMLDGSTWTGRSGEHSPDIILRNGSVWNVTGSNAGAYGVWSEIPYSSVNSLNLYGSNTLNLIAPPEGKGQLGGRGFVGDGDNRSRMLQVDTDLKSDGKGITTVNIGAYSPGTLHRLNNTGIGDDYAFGRIEVDGLALGGKYRLNVESSGAEPYTIGGRLADDADATGAHEFVSYKTSENRPVTDKDGKAVSQVAKSDADFISLSAPAELGVYQYAAEKVVDGVNNRTNIYYSSTGKLSNSAATVVSLAAAPVDVANLQSDTLAKHMNSVRHGKDSGVWVSYFGGENRNTTAAGPEYTLKTNGVMLGADTLTENNWLAGVAVSSARSDMSVMNSSGDLNSYGAQFYMSRRYDSGVFVDSALQFNHFSNTAKARMINGQQAKADFSGNSYGLEAKVGYAWNSEGFFAEPYVRAAARAFDGEHYALSNGMTVNSNDYKSMQGEIGTDLGYQYDISGGYVKPYLHLAALNEFADGNSVRVNNVSLDNSVKGAAFQAGLGAEVKVTDNLGGYAAFDYTKGDNTERPWQATVGVNYTW